MRFLLVFAVIANLALFALGQGYFGSKPVDTGRSDRPFSQRMQNTLEIGKPIISEPNNK